MTPAVLSLLLALACLLGGSWAQALALVVLGAALLWAVPLHLALGARWPIGSRGLEQRRAGVAASWALLALEAVLAAVAWTSAAAL